MCVQPPGFKALQGKEEEVTDWEKHSLFRTLGGAHNAERPLTNKWPHPVWVRQWTGMVSQRQDQPLFLGNRAPGMRTHRPQSGDKLSHSLCSRVDILGQGQMEAVTDSTGLRTMRS